MIPTNQEISRKLREQANQLAKSGDNLYRIRAFRQAAMAVMALDEEVASIVTTNGQQALEQFPGIWKSLAETIANFVLSGGVGTGR